MCFEDRTNLAGAVLENPLHIAPHQPPGIEFIYALPGKVELRPGEEENLLEQVRRYIRKREEVDGAGGQF